MCLYVQNTEVYSEDSQTKGSILDVWLGSE